MLRDKYCMKGNYITIRKSYHSHNYYIRQQEVGKRRCNQRNSNARLTIGMRIKGLIGKESVHFLAPEAEEQILSLIIP